MWRRGGGCCCLPALGFSSEQHSVIQNRMLFEIITLGCLQFHLVIQQHSFLTTRWNSSSLQKAQKDGKFTVPPLLLLCHHCMRAGSGSLKVWNVSLFFNLASFEPPEMEKWFRKGKTLSFLLIFLRKGPQGKRCGVRSSIPPWSPHY